LLVINEEHDPVVSIGVYDEQHRSIPWMGSWCIPVYPDVHVYIRIYIPTTLF